MMTRMIFLLLAVSAILLNTGCQENLQTDATSNIDQGEVREYEVFGMDCPGCQSGLEKLVNKIPGVKDSSASWKNQRLNVTVAKDTELNDEEIYDAIRRANFTVGKRIK